MQSFVRWFTTPISISYRSIAIAASVILAPIVFVFVLAQIKSPPIDISASTYQEALARWQAARIKEYEITTNTMSLGGGELTLRVSAQGNHIDELAPDARPFSTLDNEKLYYLRKFTVEGMFEAVDNILRTSTVEARTGDIFATGSFYMVHNVRFDPDLGYPQFFAGKPVSDSGAMIFDADWETTVTSLKVLQRWP